MHHGNKVDAPSGTALLLGQAAAEGRGIDLAKCSERGRDGLTGARGHGKIGFASLRGGTIRSEEHTSELQSLMRLSYAVFCLKQKTKSIIKPSSCHHL